MKGELYDYEGELCFASDMAMLIMIFITEVYADLAGLKQLLHLNLRCI